MIRPDLSISVSCKKGYLDTVRQIKCWLRQIKLSGPQDHGYKRKKPSRPTLAGLLFYLYSLHKREPEDNLTFLIAT